MTRGTWRSLLELRLFCKWQCGIFCYQPFLFLFWELFVVTWTWTLSFTMGVTIYYYLYALFKTETWNGSLFLVSFYFIFGYDILFYFVMVAHGHWQTELFNFCCTFGVSVQLYWENHCLCFLADVCIILFTHPFCPFIEKQLIKKMKV